MFIFYILASINLIYDGTRYSSGSPTAGSVTVTDLEFGRLTHTNSSYLNGSIDIALIFDRNLTYNELNKIGAKLATDYGITWNDM